MTHPTLVACSYRIDAADRIAFVNQEWVRFAEANDAPELTEEFVVGKPIWKFIAGEDARNFYASIYRNLRFRRREIVIPFRCDSPTVVRQMNLLLRPLPYDEIDCEGVLLHSQTRAPITLLFRWVEHSPESVPICSLCRRLSVQGEWLTVRDSVSRRRSFNDSPVPRLQETVCPECYCITL